jgi:RNA polymerase sigma-70 factor (ECF subfamily)
VTVELEVWVGAAEAGEPAQALGHDPADFYRAHAPELTRFATSLVGPDDAADVVADAVAKTLSARDWASLENPRAYIYRAVYRESISWRRAAARRSMRHVADAGYLGARERVVELPMSDLSSAVAAAIANLSARQRAVVFLAYWEDRRLDEIAEILHTSDGSVRKHLARARRTLRALLNEGKDEDE